MNLINAKYKFSDDEIEFLLLCVDGLKNDEIVISDARYDLKFIKKIISKTMEINTNNASVLLNWFFKLSYEDKKVKVEFSDDVKEFLLKLKDDFSLDNLKVFFSLSSNYSRAIYKILKTYEHKSKATINLEDLKSKLEVPKGFQTYSNFKMKVLSIAEQELKENSDISFSIEEKKDGKKVASLVFHINSKETIKSKKLQNEQKMLTKEVKESKAVDVKQRTKLIRKDADDEFNDEIKRIVSFFDHERKKLQPNYVRKESSYNMSGEYLLRVHLKETGRTPQMFFDAIRWLFSNNPKASFHRQYIMNIGKLIEHFNTLEHQAMYSKEAVEFNEEAKVWYNIYKKQGLSHEEILQKLKEGEYI